MPISEPGTKTRKYDAAFVHDQCGPTPGTGVFPKLQELNVGGGDFPKDFTNVKKFCHEQFSGEQDAVVFYSVKRIFHGLKAK